MKRFLFKAKNKTGEPVKGEVEAQDEVGAAKLVRGKGLLVLSIKPVFENPITFFRNLKDRITPSDVATFTRQFATMVAAGLPVTESL